MSCPEIALQQVSYGFYFTVTHFCYTLYKNPVLYEIEEIEKPLIDKGFKIKVALSVLSTNFLMEDLIAIKNAAHKYV